MQKQKQTLANRLDKIIKNQKRVAAWRKAYPKRIEQLK